MARRRSFSDDREIASLLSTGFNEFQRLDPRKQRWVIVLLLIVCIIVAIAYYQSERNRQGRLGQTPSEWAVHLLLGNPSAATSDPGNRDNFLMMKQYYALSYNDDRGEPNWVSWELTSADLGTAPRKPEFDPDNTLPPGFKVVTHHDYSGSGFDRGHMCPHSDRAASVEMSFSTFIMTNIIPQAPNVNRKAWEQLEAYGRDLARQGKHLYIIAGPCGRGGRGSAGQRDTIANGRVTVPAECWKVMVVVPEGSGDDLRAITPSTRVIAVDMPNDQTRVGDKWAHFRTSAATIEQKTGLHFFTKLKPEIAHALEQEVDDTYIPPPRPMGHGPD